MNSPLSYLLLMPLFRYQPFKRRFLIPWLLTCTLITILVTARDGTISQPVEVLVVFLAIVVPCSLGMSIGYMFNFFGAKTGVLKGWFWYLYPVIWWLPLLQYLYNIVNFFTGAKSDMIYLAKAELLERSQKLKDMNFDQFAQLFAPELEKLQMGGFADAQAEVVGAVLQNQAPDQSLGEILAAKFQGSQKEKLEIFVTVLFDLVGKRRQI